MSRFFKATVRGIYKVIGGVLLVFFPPDPDVGPSYYHQTTQDHSEYLPATQSIPHSLSDSKVDSVGEFLQTL